MSYTNGLERPASSSPLRMLRRIDYIKVVRAALKEDTGKKDITADLVIPPHLSIKAVLLAKEDCLICGLGVAAFAFEAKDKNIRFRPLVKEGSYVKKGKVIARLEGRARSILGAERVALNFLSLLSGISTRTREYVKAAGSSKAKILDTRKTIPGLRVLEKYAVRVGGGFNHRMSLADMLLVKDNHLKITGGYRRLTGIKPRGIKLEVEVKDLREFREALKLKPDIIMLDNMSPQDIKKAVKIRDWLSCGIQSPSPRLEASGGVTLKNIKKIASLGVEMISVGELTHSVKSADISLEVL